MTSKYMNFSPELVYERNAALNNCPTKSGRSKIYKTYYLKMKDAYEKDDEEYEAREAEEEYDASEAEEEYEASEADASEADASEADASDPEDEDYVPSEEEEAEAEAEEEQAEEEADAIESEAIKIENADDEEEDVIYITEAEETEVEADSDAESEDENEFGCSGCNYEWRDGYKTGWRDAMKYITNKAHKVVPPTPACSYCDIVCKTHKCGGKCGGTARYCSLECQKQDWAFGHKAKCGK